MPDYSIFWTDRTLTRRMSALVGTQNGGGVSFFKWSPSPISLFPILTRTTSYVRNNFHKRSPLLFLIIYSLLMRNTQLDTWPYTFFTELHLNFYDTIILGDFNAHHPAWNSHILSRQCRQFSFQPSCFLPAGHPQRHWHAEHLTPPLFWLLLLSRYLAGSWSFSFHMWMAYSPKLRFRLLSSSTSLSHSPQFATLIAVPLLSTSERHIVDEFKKFITELNTLLYV